MGEEHLTVKPFIEFACKVMSDEDVLALAREVTMHPGGNAQLHLDAYLKGSGLDLRVDLKSILENDIGVRDKVMRDILLARQRGGTSGTIPIPQSTYADPDWQYAIGSMNINWSQIDNTNTYRLGFRNMYRWHPDANRMTQCVHRAAENLKKKGAKDYWMVGSATIVIESSDLDSYRWVGLKKATLRVINSPL